MHLLHSTPGPSIQCSLWAQVDFKEGKEVKGIFGAKGTADHRLGAQKTLEGFISEGKEIKKTHRACLVKSF